MAALAQPGLCGGPPGLSLPPGLCDHLEDGSEAEAWWWHYSNMGGKQAPWMGMIQYDPAEPISIISSDSSPTGCGQWWQRPLGRDRFWSGSTIVGSTIGSDEFPTDDEADDWALVDDFGEICDLCDDEDDDVEELVANTSDSFEVEASTVAEELAAVQEVDEVQKPAFTWKRQAAGDEVPESEAVAAALSPSDFPLLSAAKPRRRGGSL